MLKFRGERCFQLYSKRLYYSVALAMAHPTLDLVEVFYQLFHGMASVFTLVSSEERFEVENIVRLWSIIFSL